MNIKDKSLSSTLVVIGLVTSLTGLVPVMALQPNADTLKLSLDDALKIALSDGLTVQIADKEITRQEYAKKGTYAALFPQIDFSGSYQRTLKKQVMYMDGMSIPEIPGMPEMPSMDEGFAVGRDNLWSTGFTVNLPLISVPLWKSLHISGQDVELSVEKARSSRIEMTDQVKRSFYTILLARDALDVFRKSYENAVNNYNDIRQKYEKGIVAEYDLVRANVSVKNAEPGMYDAENALTLAHWQLKAVIGLDLESNISCTGSLSEYEATMDSEYIKTSAASLDNNSDLKQIDIQFRMLQKSREIQKAQYYPSLYSQFSYQWIAMNNSFDNFKWNPYSTVGLSLNIPIFSGGKRYTDIKGTEISLDQLSLQRQNAERNLRLAVKQSVDQMSTSIKQYHAARAGVAESEKGYSITMKRYETGEGTLLDINDSQLSLTQARLNLNQSIYNYLVAKSSLEKILGNES